MRNITGQAVIGEDLFGREYEISELWRRLEQGEHILMLAPRRVGKTSLMLELRRAPRPDWDVIFVNLEAGDSAADCISAILAQLANNADYRTWLEAIPFRQSLRDLLNRVSISVQADAFKVDIKGALSGAWEHAADQLLSRLANLPNADGKLLIILDELPLLLSRLLEGEDGPSQADSFLSRLREMRQRPELRRRVLTLVGGSTGLEGVLHRARLSGLINDLSQFRVTAWDRSTASDFLLALGTDNGFPIGVEQIGQSLDLLRDPVPYHLQLLFAAVRDACKGDAGRVSSSVIDSCFRDRLAGPSGTAHLDHYAERLGTVFTDEEHDLARAILGRACQSEAGVKLLRFRGGRQHNEALSVRVLRELESDGYVVVADGVILFRSNLLREWWRRYQPSRNQQ